MSMRNQQLKTCTLLSIKFATQIVCKHFLYELIYCIIQPKPQFYT